MPRYRAVVATLTFARLRVSELCALNCEHVDLARRELRVLDAKTPAGVRRVDIHDDLQEELAAYKAARGETWQAGDPAFLNARGKRWTRNAIGQRVIPPAMEEAIASGPRTGSPRSTRKSPRTPCATPASPRSSPRAPIRSTLPPRSGTKTSRQPAASTATSYSDASAARLADAASWRCASQPQTLDERGTHRRERESAELSLGTTDAVLQAFRRWRDPDLNRGHHDFQSCALPTELSRRGGAIVAISGATAWTSGPASKD